jgi:predicted nucleotide-binding protein (sugar kinase/HSP70/actin superfamily)
MSASCNSIKPVQSNGNLNYLGQEKTQWRDNTNYQFTEEEKNDVTMLFGGLSLLQDKLISSALQSIGENYIAMPNPDFESFQKGKAFGNRGQCNPTYFNVGNLVKYLQNLRDEKGLSTEEIIKKYIFVTSGGCGPCRFGMYITEYRKALSDAGFRGFRIMSFEHNKGIFQAADETSAINFSPKFFITLVKALIIGDIINILTYKIRPYEVQKGATDKAIETCREIISNTFMEKKNLVAAMWRCRQVLEKIELNRLQPKAKVMVMGEFWAAMTEGDGNYNLHRFLEEEGAECIPQPLINRLMLSIWETEFELGKRENLEKEGNKKVDFSTLKTKLLIKAGKAALKTHFTLYAKAIGLHDYEIPNIDKLATLAKEYYPLDASGGEGHLEVAHLIESVKDNLAHLVISVKPFGCMPSSAVSDGIQSLVTNRFPSANFLSIETSGEGAANFYSRVQMALFKAKQSAKEEFEALEMPQKIPDRVHNYLFQPKGEKAGTAAQLIHSIKTRNL